MRLRVFLICFLAINLLILWFSSRSLYVQFFSDWVVEGIVVNKIPAAGEVQYDRYRIQYRLNNHIYEIHNEGKLPYVLQKEDKVALLVDPSNVSYAVVKGVYSFTSLLMCVFITILLVYGLVQSFSSKES